MKTLILILLAGITTAFAQVSPPPKAVPPVEQFVVKPNAFDAQITQGKASLERVLAEIDAANDKLKHLEADAEHGGDSNPAKRSALKQVLETLTSFKADLERGIARLESQKKSLVGKTITKADFDRLFSDQGLHGAAKPPDPFTAAPVVPKAKPVAATDPFVKGGGSPQALTGENTYTGPTNYQVLFETFDLPREDFLALLDEKGDDDVRYRRVTEWMTAGRTKLTTFTALTTRSGQRSKVESTDEVRYATEFNPPYAEGDFASPTSYETRNAGESLEVELTVSEDGQSGDINVAPQSVKLLKFVDELAEPGDANSAVSQPRFSTRKLVTNATVQMNHPRLLGTLSGAKDEGTAAEDVRVAFLTVRRTALPKAKPEALIKQAGQTRLEYTFFSLERTAAHDLFLAKQEPQACYDGLRTLVGEKKARLEHVSINMGRVGNAMNAEEIQELRYPTEWTSGGKRTTPPAKPEDVTTTPEVKDAEQHKTPPKPAVVGAPATPRVGATFEVKNTGFTSQAEPTLDEDGATVDLNLALQFVRYSGNLVVTGIAKKYPPQPLFQTSRLSSSLLMTVGQQQFIGTFNTPAESGANGRQDDGRVWLGFVRAVLVK